MKALHNCYFSKIELDYEIHTVITRERCPECGQVWVRLIRNTGWEAQRVRARFLNIKLFFYQRRMKRELSAPRTPS